MRHTQGVSACPLHKHESGTAFEMIRLLLPRVPFGTSFHVLTDLTDSQFCLQLVHGVYGTSSNLLEVAGLMASRAPVAEHVELRHVK